MYPLENIARQLAFAFRAQGFSNPIGFLLAQSDDRQAWGKSYPVGEEEARSLGQSRCEK